MGNQAKTRSATALSRRSLRATTTDSPFSFRAVVAFGIAVVASFAAFAVVSRSTGLNEWTTAVVSATFACTAFWAASEEMRRRAIRSAAEELAQRRAHLDLFMSDAIDGVFVVDSLGRIIESSTNVANILGLDREVNDGAVLSELFPPLARRAVDDAFALVLDGQNHESFDIVLRSHSRNATISVTISDGREAVDGLLVRIRDVSAEREAQAETRASQARMQVLIASSNDLIGIINTDLCYSFVSPAVEKIVGKSAEDVVGVPVAASLHPDERVQVMHVIQRLLDTPGGHAGPLEHRVGREGHWTWFETIAVNKVDDPNVRGIVFNARDVTARHESEAEVEDLTTRLRSLLDTIRSLVLMHDDDYRPLLINQQFCDELLGGVDPQTVLAINGPEFYEILQSTNTFDLGPQRRDQWRFGDFHELIGQRWSPSDGRSFERDYRSVDLGNGRRAHLWILHDVTEHDRAQKLLREALAQAEEASAMKSDFVATVSHEIRNPMHGVLGLVEILATTALDERQRELVSGISGSAEGLRRILDDILDLSKIEAGKMQIETVEFDLVEMLLSLKTSAVTRADAKGIVFSLHVDPVLPETFTGDPLRTRQVIGNLIDNAIKFTDKGSVRVDVTRGRGEGDVRFQIIDTGIGIEPHRLGVLFEPFEQAERSTTRRYGGTGLGLAICAELVRLMGGRIDVDSKIGVGSSFVVNLPFGAGNRRTRESQILQSSPPTERFAGLRVLLAEDNHVNQTVARTFLEALRTDVMVVSNGAEAVKAIEREHFDVVLMDCEMPVMDGFEAVRRIREVEARSSYPFEGPVPVIALTANAMQAQRDRCMRAGMDDFLAKPFTKKALKDLLQAVVEGTLLAARESERRHDASPLLDSQVIDELVEAGIFDMVFETFGNQLSDRIDSIETAMRTRDLPAIAASAHRLRSPAATIGLSALNALCADIERMADAGEMPPLAHLEKLREVAAASLDALVRPL